MPFKIYGEKPATETWPVIECTTGKTIHGTIERKLVYGNDDTWDEIARLFIESLKDPKVREKLSKNP